MAPSWMEKFITRGEPPIPDPLRASSQPTLSLNYSALAEHRRVLSAPGEHTSRYVVTRKSIMGAWGSKCSVTVPTNSDQEIALIDFHAFHYDIKFPLRDHHMDISTAKRRFDASGGLGELHWKATGMQIAGAASWELRDETSLVMVVEIDQTQTNGRISVWREKLDGQTMEELVVVGIAQIEEYKRMLRQSKTSAVGVILN
ncbi:hypothetical protein CC77DRAFT_389535 [Alternaria alternata]|uniref:Uncharacterized protein n=1 Tax=Alternaria alternata TaxID=5599 RepID=A0A177DAM3_ALTAL|nr:hypothetical protein CC77DRAFT_389535 [Alternaria alternata]OAG16152.1 hypothetical protein CC77DRAFT_389535 [Alternaria alternata]RYN65450.1 hypothetical protein AA0117_g12193 [Alternaria alternata]RYO56729.1 hypothetical protein AA0116_g8235 [Alternaria tenuissima]